MDNQSFDWLLHGCHVLSEMAVAYFPNYQDNWYRRYAGKCPYPPRPIGKWMWYCRTSPFHVTTHRGHYKLIEARMASNKNSATGLTTGFADLDRVTCGWQPGEEIVIAARPAVGKTAFALQLLPVIISLCIFSHIQYFSWWMTDYYHTLPMAVWI